MKTSTWILAYMCAATALISSGVEGIAACSQHVPKGDQDAGILAIDDASCSEGGGTGCFEEVCRYCKTRDTDKSKHLLSCFTAACASSVSDGDRGSGISAVADASCKDGGTGCFDSGACRFCKKRDTDNSKHLTDCDSIPPAPVPESAPVPVPESAPDSAPVVVPAPAPGVPPANICSAAVVSGLQSSQGIWADWDLKCTAKQSDCVSACRLCQFYSTTDSASYKPCAPVTPSVNDCSPGVTTEDVANGIWAEMVCATNDEKTNKCAMSACQRCAFRPTELSGSLPACVGGKLK